MHKDIIKNLQHTGESIVEIADAFDCHVLAFVLPKDPNEELAIPFIACTEPTLEATPHFGIPISRLMDKMIEGHNPSGVEETTYNVVMGAAMNHMRHHPEVVISAIKAMRDVANEEEDDE